ncbi:DUF1853 family protein [Parahaliea mediterranea]|uniref:DUF1853 family protein n=1 Tax=Parahaliea mediterranea TaxID=651086 RepID=A0A939DH55_9GAMM|nr:DUF1853 family protein [Parahaliea mediterranea]MBN7797994.1 DUF1853 family protein [Parahaliea mediterranea]
MPHPFQHACVRDLAWACFSPPLMLSARLGGDGPDAGNADFALTPARQDWLARLDADPAPLREHLARSRSRRLGLYFERLWHFFLARDPAVELLAHNLPVRENGRTLGEFDLLYYCHERRRHCHLELAVKFYLGYSAPGCDTPGASRWRDWLGPNSRDRLDLKLDRLLDHQVRLADHPSARAVLARLGVTDPLREVEMKGYLFRHPRNPLPPPRAFNPALALHSWWRLQELPGALDPSLRYRVLPRLEWLAAARDTVDAMPPPALLQALEDHFREHRQPRLVAALDDSGVEQWRCFVTDASWPD